MSNHYNLPRGNKEPWLYCHTCYLKTKEFDFSPKKNYKEFSKRGLNFLKLIQPFSCPSTQNATLQSCNWYLKTSFLLSKASYLSFNHIKFQKPFSRKKLNHFLEMFKFYFSIVAWSAIIGFVPNTQDNK